MILLSFDIEEFDVPLEHNIDIAFSEQIRISKEGTLKILECLSANNVKATFFCTANFAENAKDIVKRIVDAGHELASHGYFHGKFKEEDLKKSKEKLEEISGKKIFGYRQARMMPVSDLEIARAGYKYNSSLNPTFIPGRYMNLSTPRTAFVKDKVLQIPSSVTPLIRFPLFWLSCHNLPPIIYRALCKYTHSSDNYLLVYFHPWEFYNLNELTQYNLPFIMRNNSGEKLCKRLNDFINYFKQMNIEFATCAQYFSNSIDSISNDR